LKLEAVLPNWFMLWNHTWTPKICCHAKWIRSRWRTKLQKTPGLLC